MFTWTEEKRAANIRKHRVDFEAVHGFDFASALVTPDQRREYGEDRYIVLGRIAKRVHVLIYTPRGEELHLISLRKANQRERDYYERTWTDLPAH